MAHLTGRSRVFIPFFVCAVYTMRGKMTVGIMAAYRSAGAQQHAEKLHGIDPGLIIVLVAPFHRPLGTFHQQLSSTPQNRAGKAKA